MLKPYWTSVLALSLLLPIAEAGAQQAVQSYNCDPSCGRICNAARAGANQEISNVESAVTSVAQDIARAATCEQQMITNINSAIPSFGGGLLGTLTNNLVQNLSSSACKLIQQGQSQLGTAMPQIQVPTWGQSTPIGQAVNNTNSLWQKLTGAF